MAMNWPMKLGEEKPLYLSSQTGFPYYARKLGEEKPLYLSPRQDSPTMLRMRWLEKLVNRVAS